MEDLLLVPLWLQEYCLGSRRAGICLYYKGVIPVEEHEHRVPFFCIGGARLPEQLGICTLYCYYLFITFDGVVFFVASSFRVELA